MACQTARVQTSARKVRAGRGVSTRCALISWMDVLQIDLATLADVMVVDREHRQSIWRSMADTLAVDVVSRAVVGFGVSLENPSAPSVSLVLSHACSAQSVVVAKPTGNCKISTGPWRDCPGLIHVDNGRELHSEALLRGCQVYSIAIDHRPRRQPHLRGHIERLLGST